MTLKNMTYFENNIFYEVQFVLISPTYMELEVVGLRGFSQKKKQRIIYAKTYVFITYILYM